MKERTHAMRELQNKLAEYCEEEAFSLCSLAGLPPQHITNDIYIKVRNSMHFNLEKDRLSSAVYNLTALLGFVSLVGYPRTSGE